jgi:hypothetical protein
MSDWQQQPQQYPPPPDAGMQPPPPGYPPTAGFAPSGPPVGPPKKRTGLIIAVVVIVMLLMCCCGTAVAGLFIYRSDSGPTTTQGIATSPAKPTDPDVAARAADWEKVTAAFVKGDYTFVEPDERQRRLATLAINEVLPDFIIDELTIEPGHYDAAKKYWVFDGFYVTLHLASDPLGKTAYSFDVETPAAEAGGLKREKLDVGKTEAVTQLEGKTWVIYPTASKGKLIKGMKHSTYAALVRTACDDWPGGLPTKFIDQDDGSVLVSVETWESYRYSEGYDRVEAVYVRDATGWKIKSHKAVIETGTSGEATPTA